MKSVTEEAKRLIDEGFSRHRGRESLISSSSSSRSQLNEDEELSFPGDDESGLMVTPARTGKKGYESDSGDRSPSTPTLSLPDSFDEGSDSPPHVGGRSNISSGLGRSHNRRKHQGVITKALQITGDDLLRQEVQKLTSLLQERKDAFRDLVSLAAH